MSRADPSLFSGPDDPRFDARSSQARAQRAGWRMLARVSAALDLSAADVIEVVASQPGAHVALLARQFPGAAFELGAGAGSCGDTVRVLWAPDGLAPGADTATIRARCDAIVLTHAPDMARDTIARMAGFARVAATRDIGGGLAMSVFGRGLGRALFRPSVRAPAAA